MNWINIWAMFQVIGTIIGLILIAILFLILIINNKE